MAANPTIYSDDTPIPLGRYKFTKIVEVPVDYLRNLMASLQTGSDLKHYLQQNVDRIAFIQSYVKKEKPKMFCMKKTFIDERDAKKRIAQIREKNQKNTKPQRAYYCEICGGWHLTKIAKFK